MKYFEFKRELSHQHRRHPWCKWQNILFVWRKYKAVCVCVSERLISSLSNTVFLLVNSLIKISLHSTAFSTNTEPFRCHVHLFLTECSVAPFTLKSRENQITLSLSIGHLKATVVKPCKKKKKTVAPWC